MRKSRKYKLHSNLDPCLTCLEEDFILLQSENDSGKSYLAYGILSELKVTSGPALNQLQYFIDQTSDWVFGCLSYDLKNEIESHLSSKNEDGLEFPLLHFIQPRIVFEWKDDLLLAHYLENDESLVEELIADIFSPTTENTENTETNPIYLKPRTQRRNYKEKIKSLKRHIQLGNIYELNYCIEFHGEGEIELDRTWKKLRSLTQAPFSSVGKLDSHSFISASPERYLRRIGNKVSSEPIKGTSRRSKDKEEDDILKKQLKESEKERAENIMIVDLVRNDLSRSAKQGSVQVEELCKIYSFPNVHQMISTISCEVDANCSFTQLIRDSFPMGSMTGAPKVSAMELIEEHEEMRRGLYSGSIGYIKPNGDFDFNVVIRTLFYNSQKNYLSAMVGGAITSLSEPDAEYEECLLKAASLLDALI